ncbi:hypothetical protein ENFAE_15010 [Enterococcus faecalis]|nr:hypothetical protein ENFAE_15010 [Enterococcus faecalis]
MKYINHEKTSKFILNQKEQKFKMNKRLIVAFILVGMST